MQFVTKGPDIPNVLLQEHEEGRVVFFCGAGISYPAGLPGFQELVDKIYHLLGTPHTPIEQDVYDRKQFDATLDLLERRFPGQRIAVRSVLPEALKPHLRRKGAIDTHAALLQLARCRKGSLRLVTTNFDCIFEKVAKRTRLSINTYSAPMLPIPKNSRWNGLVYLHGLLPDKAKEADDSALNRLVLTRGDFGLAYLTERWAARFVSELFRNYVVCFVGYSINDPVLRYMMDALAADRMQGETTPQAYALCDCEPGNEHAKTIEWEAKGVTPILYEVDSSGHDHSAMHNTIKAWAETYRDGILGKERLVVAHALAHPSASSRQDDFVSRMLWALSDESGLPAKRFADFNPVPPLAWLEAFSEDCLQHCDLARHGVPPSAEVDNKLRFSLIQRPAPYILASWMSLVSGGATTGSQWDNVMFQLARWLVRHLNDPGLIIWIAQRGGHLHDRWPWLIEHELDRFARLQQEGKTAELEEIRTNAPNAIPGPLIQKLWRLLLTGRVKSSWRDLKLYSWKDRLNRDGLTTTLRLELREILAPKIRLKKPFRRGDDDEKDDVPESLKQLVDWELELATDNVYSCINDLTDECWREALPTLLNDFQQLLRDALDLLRELGEADDHGDHSHWDLPSISPHWQNRRFCDWVALIELLRDAWLEIKGSDPERATRIAQNWFNLPYSTFKRLAVFAASKSGCIKSDQWVDWLIAQDALWLWSADTMRETMRLLVLQGSSLSLQGKARLEKAILAGPPPRPPHEMSRDEIERECWQVDHSIWLHLAKLQEGGSKLGDAASQRFAELSAANPEWKLASNGREEFLFWMIGTGDPGYEESREIAIAPRKRRDLVEWLKQAPPTQQSLFSEDTWRETCRTHLLNTLYALCDLAQEGGWPTKRWREALRAWSEKGKVLRSWQFAAPLVQTMPDKVLQEIEHSVTGWMEAVSKSIDRNETILLDLCRRVLALPHQCDVNTEQPVSMAINHPIGHVTQVLLNLWFKREPNDNETLPEDIKPFFTQLCNIRIEKFRHGRVLLASRLIPLFRVDRPWTEENLLPLFNWANNHAEAKAAWEGFLRSPRLYRPLLIAFKSQFLETASHYEDLNEHSRQFAAFLTYAALDSVDSYTDQDFQKAIGALPQKGLREAAQALLQALEGAGEQREDYWKNRIQPFWQKVWPKLSCLSSNDIAESFARMSIAARGEFPAVLSAVLDWLRPIESPDYVVQLLHESGLSGRFPKDALCFLNAIIKNQQWAPRELGKCLAAIVEASPALEQDPRYWRILEYSRRNGLVS